MAWRLSDGGFAEAMRSFQCSEALQSKGCERVGIKRVLVGPRMGNPIKLFDCTL
jgi:hypothetical protein